MKLEDKELLVVYGGAFSAALLTAIVKVFTTIIDFGKGIGSSIRRAKTKNYC